MPLKRRDQRVHSLQRPCVETRVSTSIAVKDLTSVNKATDQCRHHTHGSQSLPIPDLDLSFQAPDTGHQTETSVVPSRSQKNRRNGSNVNARRKTISSAAEMSHPSTAPGRMVRFGASEKVQLPTHKNGGQHWKTEMGGSSSSERPR